MKRHLGTRRPGGSRMASRAGHVSVSGPLWCLEAEGRVRSGTLFPILRLQGAPQECRGWPAAGRPLRGLNRRPWPVWSSKDLQGGRGGPRQTHVGLCGAWEGSPAGDGPPTQLCVQGAAGGRFACSSWLCPARPLWCDAGKLRERGRGDLEASPWKQGMLGRSCCGECFVGGAPGPWGPGL